jgi:hypothetical protein
LTLVFTLRFSGAQGWLSISSGVNFLARLRLAKATMIARIENIFFTKIVSGSVVAFSEAVEDVKRFFVAADSVATIS